MKDLIIFDCFGTLLNIPQSIAYKTLLSDLKLNSREYYSSLIKNKHFDWVSIGLHQGLDKKKTIDVVSHFEKTLSYENDLVCPYSNTLDILDKLKDKYTLVLLSNLAEGYIPCVERILANKLDKMFYSCNLNMKKPDSDIFNHVIDWYNQNIGYTKENKVYLLDDKIANIVMANDLGIEGILIHSKNENEDIKKANDIVDFFNILES